ncbi:MAG TPA: sugar ABC transporter permease, partial [Luteimonas sp.]|nr:sugar ABC transporter permease [Luteimonas sp.]
MAMRARLAGWVFAGPALVVLLVFFGLPVFAALLL